MTSHLAWWRAEENKYQYFETYGPTKVMTNGVSLEWALMQQEWDAISFQLGGREKRNYTVEGCLDVTREARNVIIGYTREQFPDAADMVVIQVGYYHHIHK